MHEIKLPTACGILPEQGLNPRPLHWQADSYPVYHQGRVFEIICNKFNWKKLEVFATTLGIFGALAIAIILIQVLPESITTFTWWG